LHRRSSTTLTVHQSERSEDSVSKPLQSPPISFVSAECTTRHPRSLFFVLLPASASSATTMDTPHSSHGLRNFSSPDDIVDDKPSECGSDESMSHITQRRSTDLRWYACSDPHRAEEQTDSSKDELDLRPKRRNCWRDELDESWLAVAQLLAMTFATGIQDATSFLTVSETRILSSVHSTEPHLVQGLHDQADGQLHLPRSVRAGPSHSAERCHLEPARLTGRLRPVDRLQHKSGKPNRPQNTSLARLQHSPTNLTGG
jgi:hypothetical protein